MAIRPNICEICGQPDYGTGHECKKRSKPKPGQRPPDIETLADRALAKVKEGMGAANDPVTVRIPPDLMIKLDKARGGMTRPAKIREVLEKHL